MQWNSGGWLLCALRLFRALNICRQNSKPGTMGEIKIQEPGQGMHNRTDRTSTDLLILIGSYVAAVM